LRHRRVCQMGASSLIVLMILSWGLVAIWFFFRYVSIVSWFVWASPGFFRHVRSVYHVLVGSIVLFGLESECSCRF
jgi:hypothetical protein